MSIPLDQLYHFIENTAKEINDNIVIYHFYPHGSKNIENLQELNDYFTWQDYALGFPIYCHDQEPLNYEFYQNHNRGNHEFNKILKSLFLKFDNNLMVYPTIHNQVCLIHSEKRSNELVKYQNHPNFNCVDVYYWCHALVSLDWFRYAKHITQQKQISKTFLIYNRAWSGTREYRLRFADFIILLGLENNCKMSINPIEPELGIHHDMHKFANPIWRPSAVLENFFPISNAHSHYSAEFTIEDYESTDIEVVLETLFDDERLHLTEKSLRPIACAQPFILAGTHGSLEYLRSYGFKTFGNIWDETYDTIEDPEERLARIADLMKQITYWTPDVREQKIAQAQAIAEYNKQRFFSEDFFNQVVSELKINLATALSQMASNADVTKFINQWEKRLTHNEILNWVTSNSNIKGPTLDQINNVLTVAKNIQKLKNL